MTLTDALEFAIRTDVGKVRRHNEDAVFGDAALGLMILADGMGGHNAGEVASTMATSLLANSLIGTLDGREPQQFDTDGQRVAHSKLRERIGEANAEIYLAGHNQPYYYGMGTTLVVAWFYDNLLTVAHLGDSRAYRLRKNCFERLTRDHSLLQQQVDSGIISAEDARWSIGRNLVTQALGVNVTVAPEIKDFPVEPGDLYLLCSDGLTEMLDDMEIGRTLEILGANVGAAAEHLVKMANDNGGPDNVSVILIRVRGEFPARAGWWQQLLVRFG
ncbi:MAG TPA: Stp1/IreP family PP2C-type Ser/Thr phosphatase [Azonexus sp.]|jgi:protein phosphatase|nr:Stp1/IreP family PP2C-type Ser/Thr phosphatase [Dechloromonas sp.]HRH14709.1 Stp1/IreP family PP2C-type Ser/Thr phosphatase [Azonexus sp.]